PSGSFQRPGCASYVWMSDNQIVGTPSDRVGGSTCIRSSRSSGCRCGPGNTSLAPFITAAYGTPQLFAWNIGVTGSTTSREPRRTESGRLATSEWSTVERCESTTPLGRPGVPEV